VERAKTEAQAAADPRRVRQGRPRARARRGLERPGSRPRSSRISPSPSSRKARTPRPAASRTSSRSKFAQLGALAKEKVTETQGLVKGFKAEWKAEAEEISAAKGSAPSVDGRGPRRHRRVAASRRLGGDDREVRRRAGGPRPGGPRGDGRQAKNDRDIVEARLAAEGAALQAKVFDEFGRRIEEYASEAEARFERLEAAGAEIGSLDQALRASIQLAERRAENDFEAFGRDLEDRRKRFEEGFAAETAPSASA
jgi:hypothetical protein